MENVLVNVEEVKVATIDSREVADMLGKKHKEVLKDIEGSKDKKTVGIIPTLIGANFDPIKFFIESTYVDARNRNQKCYLVTKMGCELLGNKQQGEKGIAFSAKYVERFNAMERDLAIAKFNLPSTYKEALIALVAAEEEKELLIADNMVKEAKLLEQAPKVELYEDFLSTDRLYSVNDIAKILAIKDMGKNNLYKWLRWNKIFMDGFEAYQRYIKSGHVVHRNRRYEYGTGKKKREVVEICAYFTPKGVEYLYNKLRKEGYVSNKTLATVMEELEPTTDKLN